MIINEFATRVASIVDLELFQNHCGMIYFNNLSSQSIAQKLGTILKKQNVQFEYIHASSLTKSQRMLDNLGLCTNLKIVYGFEELTCFFEECLDAVLNPFDLQVPKDFDLLSDFEFLEKYKTEKIFILEFVNKFNQFINFSFEKSLIAEQSLQTIFTLNKQQFYESIFTFSSSRKRNRPTQQDLASLYGLYASCFIQGMNFKPFAKTIIILPQQLAKIIYEFMPYKGLFDYCKDGYGVIGLNSDWNLITTFGNKSCLGERIEVICSRYNSILNAVVPINEDLSINL